MNIKTVYRDLDAFGAYYGLDIAYSEKHKGYILGRRSRRKTACTRKGTGCFGAAGQIRTADLILTKDALYLLSYSSILAPGWGHVMATEKGLEPSTSSVTGWRSNQLNYSATGAYIR